MTRRKQRRERIWTNRVKRSLHRSWRQSVDKYGMWWEVATWTRRYMRGGDSIRIAAWHACLEWDL